MGDLGRVSPDGRGLCKIQRSSGKRKVPFRESQSVRSRESLNSIPTGGSDLNPTYVFRCVPSTNFFLLRLNIRGCSSLITSNTEPPTLLFLGII